MRVPALLSFAALLAAPLPALGAKRHIPRDCVLPDLYDASVKELSDGMEAGCFTAVHLVKAYLARIGEVNEELHAVIETNPDALEIAAQLDQDRAAGIIWGPLHGIPVLVKDNIGTADKLNTTAGSYALLGSIVPRDSHVVMKLRKAGAIILGKANLSEWAYYRGTGISNGWSARGGQTSNPYYPKGDTWGSSSGSAVSAAVGLAAVTLGSDTGGSVICPSDRQNVFGIRPTTGWVSRAGVVPLSEHQDTVGPITRWAADAALVLEIISGPDYRDNYTLAQPDVVPRYTYYLDENALQGKKICVPRKVFNQDNVTHNDPSIGPVFNQSLVDLARLGATIVDPADMPSVLQGLYPRNVSTGLVFATDFKVDIKNYLSELLEIPTGVHDLGDLIEFNIAHASLELPPLQNNQASWLVSNATDGQANSTYLADVWLDYYIGRTDGIHATLDEFGCDAIVLPSEGDTTTIATIAGCPIMNVPLGYYPDSVNATAEHNGTQFFPAPGIPFGLSFIGRQWDDANLLGLAYAYEQGTKHRLENHAYEKATPTTQLKDVM
ncbi:amidase signature enzyme [Calocera viscosa TUFC12733]|uniref:Amidase signature enzyme n=1 Tax=Calocera viscosa (strain TUFC12733) TaxID=1330018 RepID=A0A167LDD7_CALVF|nr:amidase signature enzyme [Calocera viscosa TUFC12733]